MGRSKICFGFNEKSYAAERLASAFGLAANVLASIHRTVKRHSQPSEVWVFLGESFFLWASLWCCFGKFGKFCWIQSLMKGTKSFFFSHLDFPSKMFKSYLFLLGEDVEATGLNKTSRTAGTSVVRTLVRTNSFCFVTGGFINLSKSDWRWANWSCNFHMKTLGGVPDRSTQRESPTPEG